MTAREFAELVKRMREAQRTYFRTRAASVLEESKRLEREVDAVVSDILSGPSLFDGESQ